MFTAVSASGGPNTSATISEVFAAGSSQQTSQGEVAGAVGRTALPVTWIGNQAFVSIDTALLNQRMDGFGVTAERLSTLTNRPTSTVHGWISGARRVPREAVGQIAAAVDLSPERLVVKSKLFDPRKFDHYLRQRHVSVEKLLASGRFTRYSCSTVNKWRRGIFTPSLEAVTIFERGLDLKSGALTDGALENVPAFTQAEIERWGQPSGTAAVEGGRAKAASSIKDVLRSWRRAHKVSRDEFLTLVPGYKPSTVRGWLRGAEEP